MFPVYKDSRTVKKMINESLNILVKVCKKFEIVIVDDGCPESSGHIAKSLAANERPKINLSIYSITF